MKNKAVIAFVASVFISGLLFFLFTGNDRRDATRENGSGRVSVAKRAGQGTKPHMASAETETKASSQVTVAKGAEASALPVSGDEKQEAEETALVDSFDALTDKWMEPAKNGVSIKDVEEFSACFRKVPRSRKEECLHRALNLVPDENVMLLAGVLLDKSLDKQLVETVFNDILNRDETVKKPIMEQIFKDKSHPCWADVAWILDVTGSLPDKK